MSAKDKTKEKLDADLRTELDAHNSLLVRIELLLIQILRELQKGNNP